jgi:hypothetical protein
VSQRDIQRTQRLLRRLDLEEVLADLGMVIAYRNGSDAYLECPDPEHRESNPSFHVCVEDVTDGEGRARLGWFNCWSHPGGPLKGLDFADLVARCRGEVWDRGPREEERAAALAWLRAEYVREDGSGEAALEEALSRRAAAVRPPDWRELTWPPNRPVAGARPEFLAYLERRGISADRAAELDLRAVSAAGDVACLARTVPGILFPIREGGRAVNWYVRSIFKVPSKLKGRYCPGLPFVKDAGVLWAPDGIDASRPAALVEGIFDAERVRALLLREPGVSPVSPGNVVAVLGGRIYPKQARRLRGVPVVIHVADGDEGGKTLWSTIEEHLSPWARVEFRPLPAGTDPGDAPEGALLEALRPPEERKRLAVRFRSRRVR